MARNDCGTISVDHQPGYGGSVVPLAFDEAVEFWPSAEHPCSSRTMVN
jgi:hypothetical protein